MLVLSRMSQQSVMIGHDIEIKIVDVRGDKVRLGFVAPKGIQILRRELYDQEYGDGEPPSNDHPKDPG